MWKVRVLTHFELVWALMTSIRQDGCQKTNETSFHLLTQPTHTPGHPGCPWITPPDTPGTKVEKCEPPGHAPKEQGPRPLTQPQMLPRSLWGQRYFGSPQPQQCSSCTHAQLLCGQYQLLHSAASDMLHGARDSKRLQPRLWQWLRYKWKRWRGSLKPDWQVQRKNQWMKKELLVWSSD